jgi:hypothetical protein
MAAGVDIKFSLQEPPDLYGHFVLWRVRRKDKREHTLVGEAV